MSNALIRELSLVLSAEFLFSFTLSLASSNFSSTDRSSSTAYRISLNARVLLVSSELLAGVVFEGAFYSRARSIPFNLSVTLLDEYFTKVIPHACLSHIIKDAKTEIKRRYVKLHVSCFNDNGIQFIMQFQLN